MSVEVDCMSVGSLSVSVPCSIDKVVRYLALGGVPETVLISPNGFIFSGRHVCQVSLTLRDPCKFAQMFLLHGVISCYAALLCWTELPRLLKPRCAQGLIASNRS